MTPKVSIDEQVETSLFSDQSLNLGFCQVYVDPLVFHSEEGNDLQEPSSCVWVF